MSSLSQIVRSFAGLKSWVKIWIFVLIIVNGFSFFLLSVPVGLWTAIAAVIIAVSNTLLILKYNGLTRSLAFPHLVWFPLIGMIFYRVIIGDPQIPISAAEYWYAVVVVPINALSLIFDVNDGVQWIKGKREVLGLELI